MYRAVTGSERAYHQCLDGINRLLANRVRVKLKTIVMRQTQPGLARMQALARRLDVPFRFTTVVVPTLGGNRNPLDFRLPPEAAAQAEDEFPTARAAAPRTSAPPPNADLLFNCGVARLSFMVDSLGRMRPCLLLQGRKYDLLRGTFADGWSRMEPLCHLKRDQESPCRACPDALVCFKCPALFEMETGNMNQPPAWLCALARSRNQTTTKTGKKTFYEARTC
jgi:MoaA/NifB/PqqE/SkfB family radical SAM enzyme